MYNIDNFNVTIDNTDIGAMVTSMTIYESIHGNIKAAFEVDYKINFFDVFFRGIALSIVKISYTYFDVPIEIVLHADGVMNQKITKSGKSYTVKAVSINNLNEATARICNAYSGTSSDILSTMWQETHGEKNLLIIDSEVSSNGKYIAPNVSATQAFKDIVSTAYCKINTPMFLYQRLADNGMTRFTSVHQMVDSNYLTTNGRDFTLHAMSQSIDSLKTPRTSVGSSSSFVLPDYNMDFIKKVSGGMWGQSIMSVSLDKTTDTVLKPAEVTAVPVTKYSLSEHLFDEVLSYKKSFSYILTLQEFLKSKNIKYLFYDPFVNILIRDDLYYQLFGRGSTIDKMYEKIDKRFYVGPEIDGRCAIEELDEYHINQSERHPNKNEHEWITQVLYEQLNRIR